MPFRELEIQIETDGTVQILMQGYKGSSCLELAGLLEQIVGETVSREYTKEFYEPEEQVQFKVDQQR